MFSVILLFCLFIVTFKIIANGFEQDTYQFVEAKGEIQKSTWECGYYVLLVTYFSLYTIINILQNCLTMLTKSETSGVNMPKFRQFLKDVVSGQDEYLLKNIQKSLSSYFLLRLAPAGQGLGALHLGVLLDFAPKSKLNFCFFKFSMFEF